MLNGIAFTRYLPETYWTYLVMRQQCMLFNTPDLRKTTCYAAAAYQSCVWCTYFYKGLCIHSLGFGGYTHDTFGLNIPELPGEEVHTTQLIGKSVQFMFGFNARKAPCVRPAIVQMR